MYSVDEFDKMALTLLEKYDKLRDLTLESAENFRQYYRDNPSALLVAIERCGPIGMEDALKMIAYTDDGADAVRRAFSIVYPPDSVYGDPLF